MSSQNYKTIVSRREIYGRNKLQRVSSCYQEGSGYICIFQGKMYRDFQIHPRNTGNAKHFARIDTIAQFNLIQQKHVASTDCYQTSGPHPEDVSHRKTFDTLYPLARGSLFSRSANFIRDYSYR